MQLAGNEDDRENVSPRSQCRTGAVLLRSHFDSVRGIPCGEHE